jgi:hypothetical protein
MFQSVLSQYKILKISVTCYDLYKVKYYDFNHQNSLWDKQEMQLQAYDVFKQLAYVQ